MAPGLTAWLMKTNYGAPVFVRRATDTPPTSTSLPMSGRGWCIRGGGGGVSKLGKLNQSISSIKVIDGRTTSGGPYWRSSLAVSSPPAHVRETCAVPICVRARSRGFHLVGVHLFVMFWHNQLTSVSDHSWDGGPSNVPKRTFICSSLCSERTCLISGRENCWDYCSVGIPLSVIAPHTNSNPHLFENLVCSSTNVCSFDIAGGKMVNCWLAASTEPKRVACGKLLSWGRSLDGSKEINIASCSPSFPALCDSYDICDRNYDLCHVCLLWSKCPVPVVVFLRM